MHRLHFWYPPVAHLLQSVLSILRLFRLSHPPPVVCISRPMLFYAGGFPPGGIPGSFSSRNLWLCESRRSWRSSASVQDFATIAIALQMRSLDSVAYP